MKDKKIIVLIGAIVLEGIFRQLGWMSLSYDVSGPAMVYILAEGFREMGAQWGSKRI